MKKKCLLIALGMVIGVFASTTCQGVIKVACIGDSITFGAFLTNPATQSYPAQLQILLGSGYEVKNFGVSSCTMLKNGNKPYWNESAFTDSTTYNPDIVVIMLGSNDSKGINWTPYHAQYEPDYRAMIAHYAGLSGSPVIFINLPPPAGDTVTSTNSINPAVIQQQIIPIIKTIAGSSAVRLIDVNTPMTGHPEWFRPQDLVHPNAVGAQHLAQIVENGILGGFAGIFKIQNKASGLVLNNQGSLTNGSAVTQWSATTTSSNLDWTFIATANGYYQINSCKSGKDAVVQSASTANGAGIIQWSFGSSGDDQWKPVQNSDGSYTFFNLHSGLVLEDPGSSTSTSTRMDQWSSNGGSNQKWTLLPQ